MQLDENFLQEVGLSAMPEEEKQDFLDYVKNELELRIGERIAEGIATEKLAEFDRINDPEEAGLWLKTNRPDYRDIVTRTIAEMKEDIRANREKLL